VKTGQIWLRSIDESRLCSLSQIREEFGLLKSKLESSDEINNLADDERPRLSRLITQL
jgi:hypothetical protein